MADLFVSASSADVNSGDVLLPTASSLTTTIPTTTTVEGETQCPECGGEVDDVYNQWVFCTSTHQYDQDTRHEFQRVCAECASRDIGNWFVCVLCNKAEWSCTQDFQPSSFHSNYHILCDNCLTTLRHVERHQHNLPPRPIVEQST